jgi:hypothetical protein
VTTMQAPAPGVVVIKCDPGWDDCQKAQAKAKVQKLNEACPLTRRQGVSAEDSTLVSLRDLGNDAAQAFKKAFKRALEGKPPYPYEALPRREKHPEFHPRGDDSDYAHPCMKDKLENGKIPKRPNRKPVQDGWQADHMIDIQWGGSWMGPMWMMDADVNESIGRQMTENPNKQVTEAAEFTTEGC